ncbi:MAG: Translocation and assembly module TamA [Chlamydiae bacterium]|nr:Translocation and assembly module TamA [Chlamydiota bacterium]
MNKILLYFFSFSLLSSALGFAKLKKQDEIEYKVKLSSRLPAQITNQINEQSTLYTKEKRPLRSVAALYFRANQDIPKIKETLKAFGYLDASVSVNIIPKKDTVFDVIIHIELGPLYRLKAFEMINVAKEKTDPLSVISLSQIGIQLDSPADSFVILSAEAKLLYQLGHIGYPFANFVKKEYIADPKQYTVTVRLEVDPGAFGLFGNSNIIGLEKVKSRYAEYLITWEYGKHFDNYLLRATQDNFFDTNLFSYVNIIYPDHLDENGLLPMTINVRESKFRSIFLGINYSSIDDFGGAVGWEHRNIRGLGRKLSLKADVSKKTQLFTILYRIPDLDVKGRFTSYRLEQTKHDYIPYTAKTISFKRRVDRIFGKLKNSWMFQAEYLRSITPLRSDHYWLLSLPLNLRYNTAYNPLDQTSGQIFEIGIIPTLEVEKAKVHYLKAHFSYSLFIPLIPSHRNVLALRAYFGSIIGQSLSRIPPPKRFFAGTEEFLRGYDYLTVSPLTSANVPIGGRSMMMYNAELRFKSSEDLGFILFYDLGQVYRKSYPDFHDGLLYSIGFGLRYFTLAGPLSIDFAFPLKKRSDNFESTIVKIYLSIGQTF